MAKRKAQRKADEPLPVEPPQLRRGIKVGRVRRIREVSEVNVFKRERIVTARDEEGRVTRTKMRRVATGETRTIRRTTGYEDRKTRKVLTKTEIQSFKNYMRQRQAATLARKFPEGAPQRTYRDRTGTYRDRVSNRTLTSGEKEVALSSWVQVSPDRLPEGLDASARTIHKRYHAGRDEGKTLGEIREAVAKWLRDYRIQKKRGVRPEDLPPFPREELYEGA